MSAFQAAGGSGVAFTKVRIVLNYPDGAVALETVVTFPAGATELQLTLSVPLPASAPSTGQPLALNLKYVNAAGDTVFKGGPVTVNAVPATPGSGPPPPSPVTIPISYTGPGANAVSVRINPRTITVNTGGTFNFTAQALDAAGNALPNTPIVFVSQDLVQASINAATGAGTAGSTRGAVSYSRAAPDGPDRRRGAHDSVASRLHRGRLRQWPNGPGERDAAATGNRTGERCGRTPGSRCRRDVRRAKRRLGGHGERYDWHKRPGTDHVEARPGGRHPDFDSHRERAHRIARSV